jgi:hypothetical protein
MNEERQGQNSSATIPRGTWSVRVCHLQKADARTLTTHTYLDGTVPFIYLGLWAVGAFHSTATLSSEGTCGLYGLRLMHRRNISQSRSGLRAGRAFLMSVFGPNPNPSRACEYSLLNCLYFAFAEYK